MALTSADVLAGVRVHLSSTLLSDADFTAYLNLALEAYNEHNPMVALGSLTTVANQEAYTGATGMIEVLLLYWRGNLGKGAESSSNVATALTEFTIWPPPFDTEKDINFPSNIVAWRSKYNMMIKHYAGRWEQIEKNIYLRPVPTVADEVVPYFYSKARAIGDVPEEHRIVLVHLVWALYYERQVAQGEGMVKIGSMMHDNRSANRDAGDLAEKYRNRAIATLSAGGVGARSDG